MQKRGLTFTAKAIVYLMGIAVLAICAILFPEIAREESVSNPNPDRSTFPFLIVPWIFSLPVFIALFQILKILNYIDKGEAFSKKLVKALKNIKISAFVFSGLTILGAIFLIGMGRITGESEDVLPVVVLGTVITFVSIVVATCTAVLQKLMQNAVDLKEENDLTV